MIYVIMKSSSLVIIFELQIENKLQTRITWYCFEPGEGRPKTNNIDHTRKIRNAKIKFVTFMSVFNRAANKEPGEVVALKQI
ncbi:hypothetical protein HW555_001245 [Spodoptera exigua]|uniref:Uncharacterized protein n=1 Tax=Spodoptera exigua TaxID=7107 RepID=A0A835LBF5_SPOEX|nr:hypothetical protein HW555_001245 [Spodoptera exigua]